MQIVATFTLALLLFVTLGRFQEIFPLLAPLQLGKLSVVLGLGVVLAQNAKNLGTFLFKSPIKTYILIITFLALAGIPFSIYPGDALEKCMAFLRLLLTVSIIVALGKNALQGTVISIACVVLFIGVQMLLSTSLKRIAVSNAYDPNDIALLCNTFLPFCLILIRYKNVFSKMLGLAAAGSAVSSIALTGSRGGFLALTIMALYAIIIVKKGRILLLVFLGIGASIFMTLSGDDLWLRLQNLIDGTDYNLDASSGRIEIWKSGVELILRRPILGVGIGQFTTGIATLTGSPWKTAHNTFLQIGAELGIGGLYAFCAILFFIFRLSVRGSTTYFLNPQERNLYLCLRLSLVGYSTGAFFLSHAYSPVTYTFFCLAVIMYFYLEQKKQDAKYMNEDINILHSNPLEQKRTPSTAQLSTQQKELLNRAEAQRQIKQSRLETGDAFAQKNRTHPANEN